MSAIYYLAGAAAIPVVLVITVAILGACFFFGSAFARVITEYTNNPYKHIPAVPHTGTWFGTLFLGDFGEIQAAQPGEKHFEWIQKFGPVFRYRHMFYVQRILLADPRAMMHVLTKSANYPKPEHTSAFLNAVLGNGLVGSEGEAHRRQRRVIAPAFSPQAVNSLLPIMNKHGSFLVQKMKVMMDLAIERNKNGSTEPILGETPFDLKVPIPEEAKARGPTCVVDIIFWLSRTTLDIIGETGFSYNFDSLNKGAVDSELTSAIHVLMTAVFDINLPHAIMILLSELPGLKWIRKIPTARNRSCAFSQGVVRKHANKIVQEAKAEIKEEMASTKGGEWSASSHISKEDFDEIGSKASSRALMHRMIRANMQEDLKESERLSDEELLSQMTTLILAGHETTATQTSWALHTLAGRLDIQEKLRQELLAARTTVDAHALDASGYENPDAAVTHQESRFEDLMNLKYLDCVAKEVVRMTPSVVSTVRIVKEDDIVPLAHPYKKGGPQGSDKGTYDSVLLTKGHELFIPIATVQRNPEIWGPDAHEFKPERWLNLPEEVHDARLPGHTLAFIAGARSCVGIRMAQMELKVLLAHLVSSFEFRIIPSYVLDSKQTIVRRAFVKGQEQYGTRLPLMVTKLED